MIRPSNDVMRAILNLETNTFWKEIVNWIHQSLLTQSVTNNKNTGENTIKVQGRNLELEELLKYVSKVHDFMDNATEAIKMERKE